MGAPEGPPEVVLRPATRWSLAGRLVLLVLGAAGLASGCFVVLSEQDGTATAALIGISALLLFAAAFGDRIASVRHGDTEVKLLLEGARDAAARGDDSAHDALLRAAVEVAQASVGLAPDVRVSDERLVHDLQVVNRLNEMEELRGRIEQVGRPVEAIASVDDRRVGIEPRSKMKRIDMVVGRLLQEREKTGSLPIDALLVVARLDPSDSRLAEQRERLRKSLGIPVAVVGWGADDDPAALHAAMRELLER